MEGGWSISDGSPGRHPPPARACLAAGPVASYNAPRRRTRGRCPHRSENLADPARRVLVLFAHPALHKSRIHRALVEHVGDIEGVTFHDLYEAYPRLDIDVAREQELLLAHDVVVFQHPMYWYSTPAILKEWQDLVLEHGWAYGREGTALAGKRWIHALSTGGQEAAYTGGGFNGLTVGQFLAPLEYTARLCSMTWLSPFVVHGAHSMPDEEIPAHAREYHTLLQALYDGRVDEEAAAGRARINEDLRAVLRPGREG